MRDVRMHRTQRLRPESRAPIDVSAHLLELAHAHASCGDAYTRCLHAEARSPYTCAPDLRGQQRPRLGIGAARAGAQHSDARGAALLGGQLGQQALQGGRQLPLELRVIQALPFPRVQKHHLGRRAVVPAEQGAGAVRR